jgi:hypothetical protein
MECVDRIRYIELGSYINGTPLLRLRDVNQAKFDATRFDATQDKTSFYA